MNEQFTKFYFMLKELRENSSSKEKVSILKRYNCKSVKELLFLALDYRFVYNLKKLPKSTKNYTGSYNEIRSFLFTLSKQTGTKKKEAQELANLCSDKKVRYVVECILEKDLKWSVS